MNETGEDRSVNLSRGERGEKEKDRGCWLWMDCQLRQWRERVQMMDGGAILLLESSGL